MSIFTQLPALTWLLPLLAVPVLCHLLARSRPPVYRFSSVEFLQKVVKRTTRLRQPKDWLLIALRTLAMLALLLVFPGLLLLGKDAPAPGAQRTTVVLIDRSASMAAMEGAGSRFQAACAAASEWLDSTRPDLVNLVWTGHQAEAVFPDPGPNRGYLMDLLTRSRVRPEPGPPGPALDIAWRQLSAARGNRELVIISDFQDTAWRDLQTAVPPGVKVRTIPVATTAPENLAVSSLVAVPSTPVAGQEILLLVKVANFSDTLRRTTLTLDAGGARQSRAVEVPARGEAEISLPLRPAAGGLLPVTAALEADGFPADDQAHAVVQVRESLRLAITSAPDAPAAAVLTSLAGALPWMESAVVPPGQTPACDLWFLPSWDGTAPEQIREMSGKGTLVCVHPAAGVSEAALAAAMGLAEMPPRALAVNTSPEGWKIGKLAEHAAFALFRDGAFGHPFAGSFRQRAGLPDSLSRAEGVKILASWQDESPAILMTAGTGAPVLVFSMPLDPELTDWPTRPVFVPAMAELLLRTRPDAAPGAFASLPGSLLSWSPGDIPLAGSPQLIGPDQKPVTLTSSTGADGLMWQSTEPAVPAIHRWEVSGQPVHFSAVNFPPEESDLKPAPPPAFGGGPASAAADLARQAALDRGLPLWPWLAAAALLFLLVEGIIAARGSPDAAGANGKDLSA